MTLGAVHIYEEKNNLESKGIYKSKDIKQCEVFVVHQRHAILKREKISNHWAPVLLFVTKEE